MFLAFGESVFGLALLGIIVTSLAVIGRFVYLRSRSRKPSLRLRVASGVAGGILMTLVVAEIRHGSIEYNPVITSSRELVGDYEGGGYALTLKADGTFVASGFSGGSSGHWSNFDWNLSLYGLRLSKPRVITRNGRLCIAPFYAGVDADHGVLLKKQ
jgi:hypothetical protein